MVSLLPTRRCQLFYPTKLDEQTILLLEAETSGAFVKSDLEVRPDPEQALVNAVAAAETISRYVARKMKPSLRENGAIAEVSFSIRCDGNGSVMLAQDAARGQLLCKLTIRPE